jgi:hypothetical protein
VFRMYVNAVYCNGDRSCFAGSYCMLSDRMAPCSDPTRHEYSHCVNTVIGSPLMLCPHALFSSATHRRRDLPCAPTPGPEPRKSRPHLHEHLASGNSTGDVLLQFVTLRHLAS